VDRTLNKATIKINPYRWIGGPADDEEEEEKKKEGKHSEK